MGKWAEKWAKKGHFRVCSNLRFQSQIFGFSWLGHAQIEVGELIYKVYSSKFIHSFTKKPKR